MSVLTAAFLIVTALFTATLSGVFGIAGGLVLMGALALFLPVQAAFVTHGILQLASNAWRAILHRRFVRWNIVGWYALGSVVAAIGVALLAVTPSKPVLYLLLGLVPILTWLPRAWINLDAGRPPQAAITGLVVTGLNLLAGVSGPLLDIFFVRTEMTRHQIVATKAATQIFAHTAKILVYGAPLFAAKAIPGMPPVWMFAIVVPLSMLGTVLGGRILERLSDVNFKRATRLIVTGVGVLYLIQAARLFAHAA
jgi:uncharacterized membrane protein YfcA